MRSPVKGGTIQTKILDCLAEPKPLEPASSPMIAAIPPDLAPDGIPFVEDERAEIGIAPVVRLAIFTLIIPV